MPYSMSTNSLASAALCEFLTRVNNMLEVPGWCWDASTGRIYYKYVVPINGAFTAPIRRQFWTYLNKATGWTNHIPLILSGRFKSLPHSDCTFWSTEHDVTEEQLHTHMSTSGDHEDYQSDHRRSSRHQSHRIDRIPHTRRNNHVHATHGGLIGRSRIQRPPMTFMNSGPADPRIVTLNPRNLGPNDAFFGSPPGLAELAARGPLTIPQFGTINEAAMQAAINASMQYEPRGGFSPAELAALPRESFILEISDDVCAICHEHFVHGNQTITLQCGHLFHEACAINALTVNPRCPTCRANARTGVDTNTGVDTSTGVDMNMPALEVIPPTENTENSRDAGANTVAYANTVANADTVANANMDDISVVEFDASLIGTAEGQAQVIRAMNDIMLSRPRPSRSQRHPRYAQPPSIPIPVPIPESIPESVPVPVPVPTIFNTSTIFNTPTIPQEPPPVSRRMRRPEELEYAGVGMDAMRSLARAIPPELMSEMGMRILQQNPDILTNPEQMQLIMQLGTQMNEACDQVRMERE